DLVGDERAQRLGRAAHDLLVDDLGIDGQVYGLADALVLERVLAFYIGKQQFVAVLVHADEDGAGFGFVQDLDVGFAFKARPVFQGNRHDQIHLARDQRGQAGGFLRDGLKGDLGDVGGDILVPVAVEALERGFDVGLAVHDHEGAGAVFVQVGVIAFAALHVGGLGGLVLFSPGFAHDVQESPVTGQDGIGRGRGDFHR